MDKKLRIQRARHERVRKNITGTPSRPRLCIKRGLMNIQAQVIDDTNGITLFSLSTYDKKMKGLTPYGGNVKAAAVLGKELGKLAKEKGITQIVFDRGPYLYHGKVKALAEALRGEGIKF